MSQPEEGSGMRSPAPWWAVAVVFYLLVAVGSFTISGQIFALQDRLNEDNTKDGLRVVYEWTAEEENDGK